MKIGRMNKHLASSGGAHDRTLCDLIRFAFSGEFDAQMLKSHESFWGDRLRRLPARAAKELEENGLSESVYLAWFMFDIPSTDPSGRTIVEVYLDRHGAGLTADEHQYLEHLAGSHMRLYEVTEVRPKRLGLTDLLSGDRVDARGQLKSRVMPGDLMAGRLTAALDGTLNFENGAFMFPAELKPRVMERFRRARTFAGHYESNVIFFKWSGFIFHLWWLDDVVLAPNRVH